MASNSISFSVKYRGNSYSLELPSATPFATLQLRLEDLTSVPPSLQKLLYKGKKLSSVDGTISDAGVKGGIQIQLLGSTAEEIGGLRAVEEEQKRKERIMAERRLKAPVKVRSTGQSRTSDIQFRFHKLEPLQHLPEPSTALSILQRLSDDPAIRHIMAKHEFAVGVLTELAPHEHPQLLGLNVNAGQAIKLRLRTDKYDGFRPYREIRRVLCHELTHNVWVEHDNNFKELNSKLNREVAEFELSVSQGTHSLNGLGDVYEPSSVLEAEAQYHVLGAGSESRSRTDETLDERRRRILAATMRRLEKEEEELEQSCGTSGNASGTSN